MSTLKKSPTRSKSQLNATNNRNLSPGIPSSKNILAKKLAENKKNMQNQHSSQIKNYDKVNGFNSESGRILPVNFKQIDNNQNQQLIEKLKKNRQNLCSCFDIFQLLFSSGVPLRCITHNNIASLYCENEQKQICVNCVYNSVQHKLHRVNPIKNSMKYISQDIEQLYKKNGKYLDQLKELQKTAFQNCLKVEEGMNKILSDLAEQFDRLQMALSQKFAITQSAILQSFSKTRATNQILLQQITFLKQLYLQKQAILPRTKEQPCELYSHMMLTTMNDGERFDSKMIKQFMTDETKLQMTRDIYKIRQYVEKIVTVKK